MERGWWREAVSLGVLVTLIGGGAGSLSAAEKVLAPDASQGGTEGPRIEFVTTEFDFGEVYEGQQVVHRFRLRNTGKADLVVGPIKSDQIRAYCGLDHSLMARPSTPGGRVLTVPPDGTAEIVATLNSEGLAVSRFGGQVTQKVMVYSNDLSRPRVTLQVMGRVKAVLIPDPPVLSVGRVYKAHGELPTHLPPVRLTSATPGQAFAVTKVETNSPYLHPVATPIPAGDGGGYQIITRLDPSVPDGDFGDVHLVIHTTEARKPVVNILVTGEVQPERPVTVMPQFVDFGLLTPGQERTATFTVAKGELTDWSIVRVESESVGAPVHGTYRRVGAQYEVTLSIRAPAEPFQQIRAVVRLVTGNVRQPSVTIPVVGWTYAADPFSFPVDRLETFVAGVLKEELLQEASAILTTGLAGVRDRRAVEVLSAVVRNGEDWRTRSRAATLLGELGNIGAMDVLETAARDDVDEDVREEALGALARIDPARALPSLVLGLQDEESWVREYAAELLGEIGDRRAVPALLRALEDKDQDVAVAAGDALNALMLVFPRLN
jgi:hypothetical protein